MRTMLRSPILVLLLSSFPLAGAAAAQSHLPPRADVVELSGPRIGITSLTPGMVERLAERDITVSPVITQFGWQLEKQFRFRHGGLTPVTEVVVLMGGLDQGVAIPSLTFIVGLRTESGAEFGIGPNVTPAGSSLAIAGGVTLRAGAINVPMNFALVPSKHGLRMSVLTGFSIRRR